jgi:hypothetical protein
MTERKRFDLDEGQTESAGKADPGEAAGQPPGSVEPAASSRTNRTVEENDGSAPVPPPVTTAEDGYHVAAGLTAAGYHPIVLFGTAGSGKTSLLLSLLALLRDEPDLLCGLDLGEPILSVDTPYGRFLREQAEGFYGRKTQDFIEGRAAAKTAIEAPFFIPVVIRPENKPQIRLAFMESNGEWYRPDRESDRLFRPLRRQIEEFLSAYQDPVTFIHLVPYTQQELYSTGGDQHTDDQEIREACLAIVGALKAYKEVRTNKINDRHLMLVSKWDAHDRENVDRVGVLDDTTGELEAFLNDRYRQAFAEYRNLGLAPYQRQVEAYCAGQIRGQAVIKPRRGEDLHDALIQYPKKLWRWLYRTTLEQLNEPAIDPFPPEPKPNWFARLLDRLF